MCFQHSPHAGLAARLGAAAWTKYCYAVAPKRIDVALSRGIFPHLPVHRRRNQQRAVARETQSREQVIGKTMRELGNKIRTCGRDQNRIRITREVDMRHAIGSGLVPKLGQHWLTGQCLQCRGADEFGGRTGHHRLNVDTGLHEKPRQLSGLICRHTAGQPENQLDSG